MADTASIGDVHTQWGLPAGDGGQVIWPLLVGPNLAKEILMRGTAIDAREAERIGLVTGVVGAAGGLGGFMLPSLLGAIRDQTGSYTPGLLACAVAFLGGVLVLLELGTRWSQRWDVTALQRAGVYSYRGAVGRAADDESPA